MLVDQCWWMNFLMGDKRSKLGRSDDLNMVDLRAACLAALSTFPLYPGAHIKTIGIGAAVLVSKRMCIRVGQEGGKLLGETVRKSETTKTG